MTTLPIALGTMHFGTRTDTATTGELLDAYVDLGGSWIDTADCYAFWSAEDGCGGQSETVIGEWLASRPQARSKVALSTKVGAQPTRPGGYPAHVEGLGKDAVRAGIHRSLRRLGTDHLDMYWAHMEDRSQPAADLVRTFADLVSDGLAGRVGLSNHPAWRLAESRAIADAAGIPGFSALQLRESYLHPRPDTPVEGEAPWNRQSSRRPRSLGCRTGADAEPACPGVAGASTTTDYARRRCQ